MNTANTTITADDSSVLAVCQALIQDKINETGHNIEQCNRWRAELGKVTHLSEALGARALPIEVRDGAIAVHGQWLSPRRESTLRAARMVATALQHGGTNATAYGFTTSGAARMAKDRFAGWLKRVAKAADLAHRVREDLEVDKMLRVRRVGR